MICDAFCLDVLRSCSVPFTLKVAVFNTVVVRIAAAGKAPLAGDMMANDEGDVSLLLALTVNQFPVTRHHEY